MMMRMFGLQAAYAGKAMAGRASFGGVAQINNLTNPPRRRYYSGFSGHFSPLEPTHMYAVIQTGGKQYRVKQGDVLKVETLIAEAGQEFEFDKVLMVQTDDGVKVGRPYLEGGTVTATVKAHGRHPKVKIVKFRRRKHYMKQAGHRQNYTEVQITGINA